MENYKNFKKDNCHISKKELRQLIFWANFGICYARTGSYSKKIIPTITKWSKLLKLRNRNPELGKYL